MPPAQRGRRLVRGLAWAWGVAAWLGVACTSGCAPDAAASNQPASEDAFPPDKVLSSADQAAVDRALSEAAEGEVGRPLVAATGGYRWSDVPAAISAAAGQCFVGVASVSQKDDETVATLVLADGEPGEAVVTRTTEGVQARVTLGTFGQPAEEAKFVAAFKRALARMATVRKPQAASTGGGD